MCGSFFMRRQAKYCITTIAVLAQGFGATVWCEVLARGFGAKFWRLCASVCPFQYNGPPAGPSARRRNNTMGRSRGTCRDWVIPCLKTIFNAICQASNCDADFLSQLDPVSNSSPKYTRPEAYGDAICLSCGETVNARLFTENFAHYKMTRSTRSKEPVRKDRVPLPKFPLAAFDEPTTVRHLPHEA